MTDVFDRLDAISSIISGTYSGIDPADYGGDEIGVEPEIASAASQGVFIDNALKQAGDAYVWGAGRSNEADPSSFDCSGLVYWAARQAGVSVGGTAYDQWVQTKSQGSVLTVEDALRTPGALLFNGDGTGSGRGAITHVAISLGDGRTIEARGRNYGVVVVDAATNAGRFRFAGTLPGLAGGAAPTFDGGGMTSVKSRLGAITDIIAGKSPRNVAARWGGISKLPRFGVPVPGSTPAAGGGDIDRFMSAISGQESGGDYDAVNADSGAAGRFQIMPTNWAPWAAEAGLGANAPRTPANQDRVARFKMTQYFRQFGSWSAVAVAWYAGPSAAAAWLRNPNADRFTRRQGGGKYPSIREYVQQVLSRMGA